MQAAVDLLRQTPGEADVQPSADNRAGDLLRPAPSELAPKRAVVGPPYEVLGARSQIRHTTALARHCSTIH